MRKSALGWRYVILPLEITEGGFCWTKVCVSGMIVSCFYQEEQA